MNTAATRVRSSASDGLLLDDRGQRHEFVDAVERQVGRAPGPDFGQHAVALAHHEVEDVGAGVAAAEGVGLGQ